MRIDITPEPSAEERAAIELALAELAIDGRGDRGAWWRQGLAEATADDPEGPQAG